MKSVEEKKKEIEKSLYSFLKERSENVSERYLFNETHSITYQQAADISEALAIRLHAFGINKGDPVAVRATRSIDTVMLFFALQIIGAVAVMTDAHIGVRDAIRMSGTNIVPAFYITNENAFMDISASGNWVLKNKKFLTVCPVTFDVPEHHDDSAAKALAEQTSVNDPSLVIFTSGSTGNSKAVTLCQRNVIANSVDGSDMFGESHSDTNVLVLPLHHIFGIALVVCALISGHDVYIPQKTDPQYVLRAIDKYKISIIYGVPTYVLSLCEFCDGLNGFSPRFVLIAGGPSTPEQAHEIERKLHTRVIPVYGMSEYVGISTCSYDDDSDTRCRGVGAFYPLNEGFILDDNGKETDIGKEGEICVRGPVMMLGYYGNEEETRKAIDSEGRLHTGDLGYVDARGILHITGRKKDIIIRGGENLSAGKIEKALMSVGGVLHGAVVAKKDSVYGEVPVAAVVLRRGARLNEKELKNALSEKLLPIEIPEKIIFLSEFPLKSTGKADKAAISALFDGENVK